MDAKTIVAVVLVVFIIGGFIFLQIKNRGRSENFAHGSFTEVHYEQAKDG